MPSENLQLVVDVFGGRLVPGSGEDVDLIEMVTDEALLEDHQRLFDPTAPIEFETPYGGLLGGMGGPFCGAAGFHEGWAEWLGPWESYALRSVEVAEVENHVLLLVRVVGTMSESGLEIDAPAAAIYTIENGTVVRIRHFLDQDQARAAVGLTA